jgi:hypothetical protein
MSAELTSYELFVLQGHLKHPRRESEVEKRRAALVKLSKLGYLHLKEGLYHLTPAGRQILDRSK